MSTLGTFLGLGDGGGPSRLDSLQLLFGTDGRSHSVSATGKCEVGGERTRAPKLFVVTLQFHVKVNMVEISLLS